MQNRKKMCRKFTESLEEETFLCTTVLIFAHEVKCEEKPLSDEHECLTNI